MRTRLVCAPATCPLFCATCWRGPTSARPAFPDPRSTSDTLDYTGCGLHEGSKLIWASAGEKRRELGLEPRGVPDLPEGFSEPRVAGPGLLVVRGPAHSLERGEPDPRMEELARRLGPGPEREAFPLVAVVDDAAFCAAGLDNFLWVVFTRSDPATDSYGAHAQTSAKHWSCAAPLVLDARLKPFHAPPLEAGSGRHAQGGSAGRAGRAFAWIFLIL